MRERILIPLLAILTISAGTLSAQTSASPEDLARWEARASKVEIIRDDWGTPHIYGPTDADAIFGMIYAQAEDDFPRIERNFLISQGRLAEAEGEAEIWRDLRMRLFIDPVEMKRLYAESPAWLQQLMDAWADGLNYFLHTHPEVKPRALTRFEPWMALTFSEGSIGGDIAKVNLRRLESFYANPRGPALRTADAGGDAQISSSDDVVYASSLVIPDLDEDPNGSNGIALAPQNTRDGHALLLINPHTSIYFRHEAHVVSGEGLNVYGASTWGQFFVYQGFNETAGWMHTTSKVDNIDEFIETIIERDGKLVYRYGKEERPVQSKEVTIRYREADGSFGERSFTTYRTHHGPIVRALNNGKWVSVAMMERPREALIQSYIRTKARNLDEFLKAMEAHTNSSNNTLFADREGNIAFLHSNFIPRRDDRFDYLKPVDGSDPATDWQGLHTIEESPNAINPSTGFAYNTNNWPYSAAGSATVKQEDYPRYMDTAGENYRGIHALMLLEGKSGFTLESLRDAAFSTYMPAFEVLIPALVRAWDGLPASSELRTGTAEQIELLRNWDFRWDTASVPMTLATFWGEEIRRRTLRPARSAGLDFYEYTAQKASAELLLDALATVSSQIERDFGDWRTPWGEINRFQRLSGDIELEFDDEKPSIPVGFGSLRWGGLATFVSGPQNGTRRWYGKSGNSFVAIVEFGPRLRAKALHDGGLSGDPNSPHFFDQAELYVSGKLRTVYFYRDEVEAAARRTYRPGQR